MRKRRREHDRAGVCFVFWLETLAGSVELGLDDRSERIPCSVQSRLHCAEVAVGDLGDLLVRLTLELAQNEDLPVVLGKLCDRLLDELPKMPLAVQVVRPSRRILELQRTLFVFPIGLDRLEQ